MLKKVICLENAHRKCVLMSGKNVQTLLTKSIVEKYLHTGRSMDFICYIGRSSN